MNCTVGEAGLLQKNGELGKGFKCINMEGSTSRLNYLKVEEQANTEK